MSNDLEIITDDILRQGDGKPWIADGDRFVPKKCPICGENMGLFIEGEPIFRCKSNKKHYYGTLEISPPESEQCNPCKPTSPGCDRCEWANQGC